LHAELIAYNEPSAHARKNRVRLILFKMVLMFPSMLEFDLPSEDITWVSQFEFFGFLGMRKTMRSLDSYKQYA
jgi:hypothetical protein